MKQIIVSVVLLVCLLSCDPKATQQLTTAPSPATPALVDTHEQEILAFRAQREAQLTRPTGWLSLIGLYWLEEGMNSFGAADDNTIQVPGTDTETIGAYQKAGDEIFFGSIEGTEVLHRGQPYMGGPVDMGYPPVEVNHGNLYWYVLKRDGRYGLRMKDTLAKSRTEFAGIPYFPIDDKYRFEATVRPTQDSIAITNVMGATSNVPVAAYIEFGVAEQYYSLAALDEGGDSYFVIFSDETTATSSYGGGRFIYPIKPCDSCEQITILDFNKAVNPPCAYTDFATCPLPPAHNRLRFKVEAGECALDDH